MNTRTNATLIPLFSAPKKDLFSAEKINLFTPPSANYSALKKYPILPPRRGGGEDGGIVFRRRIIQRSDSNVFSAPKKDGVFRRYFKTKKNDTMKTEYESPQPDKTKCRSSIAFDDLDLNGEQLASAIHCQDILGHMGAHHANVTSCNGQSVYLDWDAK